jgi:hypothetical protein
VPEAPRAEVLAECQRQLHDSKRSHEQC